MDALISGQASIAILLEGADVRYFSVDAPDEERICSLSSIPHLVAGCGDLEQLNGTTRDAVQKRLRTSWRCDRALRLTLILLDASEPTSLRREASEYLEPLLTETEVRGFVRNRLWSSPLARSWDPTPVLECAVTRAAADLITELYASQERIRRVHDSWVQLPSSLFEDATERTRFELEAIAVGAFARLASALSNDEQRLSLATVEVLNSLKTLHNYRAVIQSWVESLRGVRRKRETPMPMPAASEQDYEESEVPGASGRASRREKRRISAHEAYTSAQQQKESIVAAMKRGDWPKARTFIEQLIESQLANGPPIFLAKSLCDLAQQAKLLGNPSMQLELTRRAVDIHADAFGWGQLGDACIAVGEYDQALKAFERAGEAGSIAFSMGGIARVYRAQGRTQEAIRLLHDQQLKFPHEIQSWLHEAEALRDVWRYEDALRVYVDAMERFPDDPTVASGFASTLADLGNLREAVEAYEKVLRLNPGDVVAANGRAAVLKQMGRFQEALAAYTEIMDSSQHDSYSLAGYGEVLRAMGRLDEALAAHEEGTRRLQHEPYMWIARIETLKELRRYDEALDQLDVCILRFPRDARFGTMRGHLLRHLGRFAEALQVFDGTLQRFPYDLAVRSGRATTLKELGHAEQALVAYDEMLVKAPTRRSLVHSKAAILITLNRLEEAGALLTVTHPRTRDDWIAFHVRGMLRLRQGRVREALDVFSRGLAENPFAEQRKFFSSAVAIANIRLNRLEGASRALEVGDEPISRILRLHVHGTMNDLERARREYESTQTCPPVMADLRRELGARFGIRAEPSRHDDSWIFEQEIRCVLLAA